MAPARKLSPAGSTAGETQAAEQTTMRVSRTHSDALRLIAAIERTTIYSLTERIVAEYIEKYEQVSGQSILKPLQRGRG